MPTTEATCSCCGRYLDKHGNCFFHPLGDQANNMPGFVAEQPEPLEQIEDDTMQRVLRCNDCGITRYTSEDGAQVCPRGHPMQELQSKPAASSEAEDIRRTLEHIERIHAWRRAAILATIAALTGWAAAIQEWVR